MKHTKKYYYNEFQFYLLECQKQDGIIEDLKKALIKLSDSVDDSLLLDEELHNDWEKLNKSVIKARKVLKKYE